MQAITSPKTDTLSFLDQCTFVCLKYIVQFANIDIQQGPASAVENLSELAKIAAQEAAEFGEDNGLYDLQACTPDYKLIYTLDSFRIAASCVFCVLSG